MLDLLKSRAGEGKMKNRIICFISILLGGLVLTSCNISSVSDEWTDLSGSFDGWHQVGDANWRIEDGEFVVDSGKGHLVTKKSYTDVRITLDFWAGENSNSGIYMRISDPDNIADSNSYEINIFDTRPDQTYRTGGLVNFAAPSTIIDSEGHWNTYDITMNGDHIVVILNGVKTVDVYDSTHRNGPISLQYGQGKLRFRNVRIYEKL